MGPSMHALYKLAHTGQVVNNAIFAFIHNEFGFFYREK